MTLNKNTIIIIGITLLTGVALGALFFGGSSPAIPEGHEDHEHELSPDGQWTCSMHPQVRQSEPGSCPFCGMALITVDNSLDDDPTVLKMSNQAIQLANIQTTTLQAGSMNGTLKLNGRVQTDERRVNRQTTHFAGRVEKLYKNFEGGRVRKGDKIASIYSPELVAAQEELIEAKKRVSKNPVLLEAARKKLGYWKLSDEQIEAIENAASPMRNFDLLADFDGIVTQKMVKAGDHLHEGEALLEITDLEKVWVVFDVYEQDLPKLSLGTQVTFSTRSSNANFTAPVSFIAPEVDPTTRIVQVRLDLNNLNQELLPDMFVEGLLEVSSDEGILVPKSAVLWTGKRSVVYLKGEETGSFQLREVTLGEGIDEHYLVLEGLKAGEEVVTNGAFVLDAEAQLRGQTSMMNRQVVVDNPEDAVFQEVELPDFIDYRGEVSATFQEQLTQLSEAYVALKNEMVEGNGTNIRKAGVLVKNALDAVDASPEGGAASTHWATLLDPMQASLTAITQSGDRDQQRLQFINLSKALINGIQSFGTSLESPLYIQFCPMANNDKGATWISLEEEIINPYFGDVMLHCGNVEDVLTN